MEEADLGRRSADRPEGARSTVLSVEEEAVIVAFRRYTLLPLDDCLYALQPTIPHLTRSSLHRCLQRHGIGRLPDIEGDRPAKRKFKSYPIGYFHIDIAEVRTEQGKLHMFVAIDRTSKFAFVELHEKATTAVSKQFLLRPGREDEPDHQGRHGQALLLRQPRSASTTPRRLRRSLQLRPQAQDPQGPHALRVHLQNMGRPARTLQVKSDPANAGTKHCRGSGAQMSLAMRSPS